MEDITGCRISLDGGYRWLQDIIRWRISLVVGYH